MSRQVGKTITQRYLKTVMSRLDLGLDVQASDIVAPEKIVADLSSIEAEAWEHYAFLHEPIGRKLCKQDRRDLMARSIDCGVACADRCVEQLGTSTPSRLAAAMGVKIKKLVAAASGARVLFAEFNAPDMICINADTIKRAARLLGQADIARAFGQNISVADVLIGHELFHAAEQEHADDAWTRTHQVVLWKWGKLRLRSHVSCLSEIGAMAFTQRLNKLTWSPYLLDSFLVYGYSRQAATALYREMMDAAAAD